MWTRKMPTKSLKQMAWHSILTTALPQIRRSLQRKEKKTSLKKSYSALWTSTSLPRRITLCSFGDATAWFACSSSSPTNFSGKCYRTWFWRVSKFRMWQSSSRSKAGRWTLKKSSMKYWWLLEATRCFFSRTGLWPKRFVQLVAGSLHQWYSSWSSSTLLS